MFSDIKSKTRSRETHINGKTYTIQLLSTSLGIKVKERIIRAFGPMLGVSFDYIQKGEDIFPEDFNLFTDLSIALVRNLTELDVVTTIQLLLADSYCDGHKIDFEDHFAGNYSELYLLVEFALKENFGSFFTDYLKAKGLSVDALREMLPKAQTTEEQEQK